jgi:hypothetical protein
VVRLGIPPAATLVLLYVPKIATIWQQARQHITVSQSGKSILSLHSSSASGDRGVLKGSSSSRVAPFCRSDHFDPNHNRRYSTSDVRRQSVSGRMPLTLPVQVASSGNHCVGPGDSEHSRVNACAIQPPCIYIPYVSDETPTCDVMRTVSTIGGSPIVTRSSLPG